MKARPSVAWTSTAGIVVLRDEIDHLEANASAARGQLPDGGIAGLRDIGSHPTNSY
jgi:hypothetical protein